MNGDSGKSFKYLKPSWLRLEMIGGFIAFYVFYHLWGENIEVVRTFFAALFRK
jgi:hypothetical protein